jgi:WhiB family redox-sensing transcriptional regulator
MCVGEDPEIFFPSHGDPGAAARRICAFCAVRGQCLEYAIDADESGIWGGLDQRERAALRRQGRRHKAAVPSRSGDPSGLPR